VFSSVCDVDIRQGDENTEKWNRNPSHFLTKERHMLSVRLCTLFGLVLIMASSALAGDLDIRLEGGGVWFSRNDVRIPGDDGTKFDMLDLTGKGPDPYVRFYATYEFNDRHALRLTLAPLEVDGTGRLSEDVTFKDDVFTADTLTKGTFKFNTYRLTYRWSFYDRERWRWGLGAAALDSRCRDHAGAGRQEAIQGRSRAGPSSAFVRRIPVE
jgi:hypothetical protein